MTMDYKKLLGKLYSLRDLRHAINEVKTLQKDAEQTPITQPQQAQPVQALKDSLNQHKNQLKHMRVNTDTPGKMVHEIGHPGANWHYEIGMDMHQVAQKQPAFTVRMVNQSGKSSQHPNMHNDISSAVKAMVHHSMHGKWNE